MSKTIIENMHCILGKLRLSPDSYMMSLAKKDEAQTEIREVSKVLGMSDIQVLIMTAVMEETYSTALGGSSFATRLGMDYLEFLTYHNELMSLKKMGYIRIDKKGHYSVPKAALNALLENTALSSEPVTGLTTERILCRLKKYLIMCSEEQMDADECFDEISFLIKNNPEASFSKASVNHIRGISFLEGIILYLLLFRYWFSDDDCVWWPSLQEYFSEDEFDDLSSYLRGERMELQKRRIIEFTGFDALITQEYIRITAPVKEDFLKDVGGLRKENFRITAARKIESDKITPKKLFYNFNEESQVQQLKKLLNPDRFDDIRYKMLTSGFRTGFTCLLYGAPGTGKTETVYQIARESGRDLFIVDVSKIKSCWVGESEKHIKEVFDNYRSAVNAGGTVPILLFNEADGIFGIRPEGADSAVDKMENSIQNIILQELEDLDGILIATTNLTTNFDRAFERRFLYKIRFEKPSTKARAEIWKSMLPTLLESEAIQLADEFDFSGGQIENVARKKAVKALLCEYQPSFSDIRDICCEENIEDKSFRRKIGF